MISKYTTYQISEKIFVSVLLAHDCSPDDLLDGLLVANVLDLVARKRLQDLQSLLQSKLVTVGDLRGLEAHSQKLFGLLQQSSGKDDDEVGSVTDLTPNES